LIKIKNSCPSKDIVKRMKRQATDWEKIFVKHLPDKGLVCTKYKEISKLNNSETNQLKNQTNLNMGKDMKRHFTKEDIQMAADKRCSTSLSIRKMQTETIMQEYYMPFRMVEIKKINCGNTECW
ncbi:LORF2 protein, partial [Crocuta crocuta]